MARALQNASKAQQSVALAQQAQAAARQAATSLGGSVPDGLVIGGLAPVTNPVSAANDPTGLSTWQGANAPTQTNASNGSVTVTVQQTAARAILDWQTLNVGANTTLNFDQSQNGVAQSDWVVLNRVVGQIDPTTGLRNPNLAPAPSQILGAITSQGTVLIINQNGIIFGAGAQINTNSLIASSLDIGQQLFNNTSAPSTIAERDSIFLTSGILSSAQNTGTLSGQAINVIDPGSGFTVPATDPLIEGAITVQAGAEITSGQGGYILLAAPQVTNSGTLTSSQGQVSLVSGRNVTLTSSSGASDGVNNPNIRGLVPTSGNSGLTSAAAFNSDFIENTATGLIQAPEGYASLISSPTGTIINAGTITATTSVARNGYIQLGGANIQLTSTSVIAITPDDDATVPQDPNSLADFKPSLITIGENALPGVLDGASINIAANSLIYAPNANVNIGATPGLPTTASAASRVFIDSGAVIDVSGLKDVQIAASTNQVTISPVTANDTADTPDQRTTLDHTTITVDARLSGVRSDGVTWVGSPLIPAQAYAQQVGVTASQLMTKGGNVVLGAVGSGDGTQVADVIVKPGATIDVSGGWVTYQAGNVQTTDLISASGAIVNVGNASPDEVYLGVYDGYTVSQPRYGISTSYANPLLLGGTYSPSYIQGSDAGSLTIKSSEATLEGTIYANAFTGPLQAQMAQAGSATPTVYGDERALQAAGSQLPAGGFLFIQEVGPSTQPGIPATLSGGDIDIIDGPTPATTAQLSFGQVTAITGAGDISVTPPTRPASSYAPSSQTGVLTLSAPALSAMGLGQLSLYTSGALTVEPAAYVTLAPGGIFSAVTGRAITIDGGVTAPSGTISLQTVDAGPTGGSIFHPTPQAAGDYDVNVNGQLSTAGLWSNDYGATTASYLGPAYTNGGSVNISVAGREDALSGQGGGDVGTTTSNQPSSTTDVSGSILIAGANSLIDVSAGGYVAPNGALSLTAKGGNVSLIDNTAYFPFELDIPGGDFNVLTGPGFTPGFRINGNPNNALPINPDALTSKVAIGDGAIRGFGFAGGGTFSLTTPSIALSDGIAASGTNLPLDFFSTAGFGTYNITSYATDLVANTFTNGYGGYNAVLATQILTIQNGQDLELTQTGYSTHLTGDQVTALRRLTSGGGVSSVLTPGIMPDTFDQQPVSLTLGGLIELEIAPGGQVTGGPGAFLSASQINNEGTILLPGGTLSQAEFLPSLYAGRAVAGGVGLNTVSNVAVVTGKTLADIFSTNADGSISEGAASLANPLLTNAGLAASEGIYLTGDMPANVGIALAPGSVTDLSGTAIVNPYAKGISNGRQIVSGTVIGGGLLQTANASGAASASTLFATSHFSFNLAYVSIGLDGGNPFGVQQGLALNAAPGATINLSGASAVFDQLTASSQYVPASQWSNGGSLTIGGDATLTGAIIHAQGGAAQATGGVLTTQSLTLTNQDPASPAANVVSADQIEKSGFGTLVVQGDLKTSGGPVDLTLAQGFYLEGAPASSDPTLAEIVTYTSVASEQNLFPTISVAGTLSITAPYIALDGGFQTLESPTYAADTTKTASGSVILNAQTLDISGAVLFDQAVGNVALNATGDIRLIGVAPYQSASVIAPPSLIGQLSVNGNLTLAAAQVYATTGSSFDITSVGTSGVITITSPSGAAALTPYSAGSNLLIQAATVLQNGVVRAPVGSLTLGANTPLSFGPLGSVFAPATTTLELGANSVTSVSADGLTIPYGTTTDQTEYFFSPNNSAALTAPPSAILTLAGQTITTAPGATVDMKGGGDLFAYEFIPGTGGSRDILDQFNADAFTSNGGYQYADHRQVYAIVPGLSNAAVAAYDPLYSANYAALYAPGTAGQRVYLNGGQGVSAGWYTLLPAQYALLPGGMEVVEDTSATTVPVGASQTLPDGSVAVTGVFGGPGGAMQSTPHVFDIKNQAVINTYSDIALTSANTNFTAQAAEAGVTTPRLPIDAGRLIITPVSALDLSGTFETAPGTGGRGSEIDISASNLQVVSALSAPTPGTVQLSASQLSGLNADSLLIGGVRTDNADGTTTLDVTANQVTVGNDAAHPLFAADILLVADGANSAIAIKDGAAITATGTDNTGQTGSYLVDGANPGNTADGAFVRVSAGPQRLITRQNVTSGVQSGGLTVGAASLTGNTVLLDSNSDVSLSPSIMMQAANIALDAPAIALTSSTTDTSVLVLGSSLLTSLAQAQSVILRSPSAITIDGGSYSFGNLSVDASGLSVMKDGIVNVSAQKVELQNSFADGGACAGAATLACGSGQFNLNSQSLIFGDGALHIYGAGQGVTLAASGGIFFQGQATLDVGAAPLALQTPFLGDQMASVTQVGNAAELPSLAITTGGAFSLTNPTGTAAPSVAGLPGATLSLSGQNLSVVGVDVRATAGVLTLASATGIDVGAGTTLETPGYARSFGDAADPFSVTAPGGLLTLTASNGDMALESGSTVSVGGGTGAAGSLVLNAANGAVSFNGALNATAPTGGASFTLNEAGAFDLAGFESATNGTFNGTIAIQTNAGDLNLAGGQNITATNVSLTANGGAIDIEGTIDVSGVNGGDIGLFGANGVVLGNAAVLAARASGYGAADTRQATGGTIELGVAGSGGITINSGAVIDVSAAQTSPRIVEGEQNGIITYNYVAADQGGTVILRAPAIGADSAESVNISVASSGSIKGADSIVVEGYRAYDLAAIGADGQFVGVDTTTTPGTAILDTTTTGLPNFLASETTGTLPFFIQHFDITSSYGGLGGLASQANFHARPGVELDYNGNITLASNWNLGAGTVDVPGAVAAGLMTPDQGIPGSYTIVPGAEAAIFSNFTQLTYRVGGSVLGEPGMLSLKAGGQLNINGSITDGFFSFGDQTDPQFLATIGDTAYSPILGNINIQAALVSIDFGASNIQGTVAGSVPQAAIPYDASANTPGALRAGPGGAGDPLGGAEMFPLVQTAAGKQAVNSWSYDLTGGGNGTVNPLAVQVGAAGGVTVQGTHTYDIQSNASFTNTLLLQSQEGVMTSAVTADQFLAAILAANPGQKTTTKTTITFSDAPAGAEAVILAAARTFFAAHPGQFTFIGGNAAPTGVQTTLTLAAGFLEQVSTQWSAIKGFYAPPASNGVPQTANVSTLIRTGTGSINLAAASDIDLRNGVTPTYLDPATGAVTTAATGLQRGGVAIYTVGTLVVPGVVTAQDTTTGASVTLDPSLLETVADNIGVVGYGYGVSTPNTGAIGLAGIQVANAVYANGGGNVSLNAGGDVLGRRDAYTETRTNDSTNFIGFAEQPWRTGLVGDVSTNTITPTNIVLNPQLFVEGAGALGGGNVTVKAGGNISDLTVVADTTVTTGTASGGVIAGQINEGLLTFGGGNVTVDAAGNLLGGRIDVASGIGNITVGESVISAGTINIPDLGNQIDDSLRLRLADATVDLSAHGDVLLEGIAALGVQHSPSSQSQLLVDSDAYAANFYSPAANVSLLGDGSITLANAATDVVIGLPPLQTAVLPGSVSVQSLTGNINLNANPAAVEQVILVPTPSGTLTLAAGANIEGTTIGMLDSEPGDNDDFPAVLPNTNQSDLQALHDPRNLHAADTVPNRIYAGVDIDNLVLSVPKQTRIGAGRDILNMMFFGQNLNANDITRIVAGRDITATTKLTNAVAISPSGSPVVSPDQEATLQGNTFVLGGPGSLMLEAGRNLGPFLTSATIQTKNGPESFAGGVLTIGNADNPNLAPQGANLYVEFGVAKGQDFTALSDYYLNPANMAALPDYLFSETLNSNNIYVADRSQPIYASQLIAYMQTQQPAALTAAFGTTAVDYAQAYQAFTALPALQQRPFLLQIYFNELSLTSVPGPTFDDYTRGYTAANLLFPSSLGYTANNLAGGTNGANTQVQTGDLDLRLATLETQYGGNIDILGPGGRVLAGSTVATAQQAARRNSEAAYLYAGNIVASITTGGILTASQLSQVNTIDAIPAGYEGVITLRGGNISTFTDGDFVLNQSRLFTEQGGDIIMWSSNGDLNAGQGPKTSSNFPPVLVKIDQNALSQLDQATGVTGAGIAAFKPAANVAAPNVYLIAPRGTVDFGAAGVRVAGNIFVAALHVANADNLQVGGIAIGLPPTNTVANVSAETTAASSAATKAAVDAVSSVQSTTGRSIITVDVLGFGD